MGQSETTSRSILAVLLTFILPVSSAFANTEPKRISSPYKITLSPFFGEVTRSYPASDASARYPTPDFVIIQDAHGNPFVQRSISHILKQLQNQKLLPDRIAVEGTMGPVTIPGIQHTSDRKERKKAADDLVARGQITGSMHFVLSQGNGRLYGLESTQLYDTSVEMFRRSYQARAQLNRKLAKLETALAVLAVDPKVSGKATILAQDVRVIRRLIEQRVTPSEIHQVMQQAVFAVDHLKTVLPEKTKDEWVAPVAAAVNFYVLALLRDQAFYQNALELRERDNQKTTVIIAGGFHTEGLVHRLRGRRFSYVVITPNVKMVTVQGQRKHVERLLGYQLAGRSGIADADAALVPLLNPDLTSVSEKWTVRPLVKDLRKKLVTAQFSIPDIHDIFTAMDRSWVHPDVRVALIQERSRILSPSFASRRTKNTNGSSSTRTAKGL